jgi:hypothetical protein
MTSLVKTIKKISSPMWLVKYSFQNLFEIVLECFAGEQLMVIKYGRHKPHYTLHNEAYGGHIWWRH